MRELAFCIVRKEAEIRRERKNVAIQQGVSQADIRSAPDISGTHRVYSILDKCAG